MPIQSIDELLAKARLLSPAYTNEELATAQDRLAAATAANRLVTGALAFDDATAADLWADPARPTAWESCIDWGSYTEAEVRERQEAIAALRHMCKIVISQPGAFYTMSTFLSGSTGSDDPIRILEPEGARVLACVLHLAAREDSARFWWQFAAGADDNRAKFCLFLHHLALGETQEAQWWHGQVPTHGRQIWTRAVLSDRPQPVEGASALRLIASLKAVPNAMTEVVGYVKTAVRFVDDDVDLPLPAEGFAARIEEMTTGV